MFDYEKPEYEVLKETEEFEIRRYLSFVVAEVEANFADGVGSDLSDYFKQVAGYIFGENKSDSGKSEKIAMTVPVWDIFDGDKRRVSFYMPSKYKLESLPKPKDERVILRKTDPVVVAVKKIRGSYKEVRFKKELASLRLALTKADIKYTDKVFVAYYSPPLMPGFMKKAEIMVELDIDVKGAINDQNIPEDSEIATLAGGCFWCIEAPFDNLKGVYAAISGYSGGSEDDAEYYRVASGRTNHREAVQVYYDPSVVSYREILTLFWKQIDPTDPGGQFADRGRHYTTAIYYRNDEQKQIAEQTKKELDDSGKFDKSIVTEVVPFENFYPAEAKHQNFAQKQAAYYQRYKYGSGRGGFIEENWG